MSDVQGDGPTSQPSGQNITSEIIAPTYWGSLLALVLGISYTVIASIKSGPPAHVLEMNADGHAVPIFYGALVFVMLFTTRYYCAVCVNVFGETDDAVFKWPKGAPRVIGFSMLCLLVTLAVSSVGAVIALGVATSILICGIMAIISLIMFATSSLLHRVDGDKYGSVPPMQGVGDVALLGITWWVIYSMSGGPTETTVLGLFVITAIMAILVTVEFNRIYLRVFQVQMARLLSRLFD